MTIAFEFSDCGVDHAQYFPGVSAYGTDWDDVIVGAGDSFAEAFEDAACQACETGYDDVFPTLEEWAAKHGIAGGEAWPLRIGTHADCEEQWYLDEFGMDKSDYESGLNDEEALATSDAFEADHAECELRHYVALYIREE